MRLEARQGLVKISLTQPGGVETGMSIGFIGRLDDRLREMSEDDRANYGKYFIQQKAFATSPETALLSPEVVAAAIVDVFEADAPMSRYPLGSV
jgi:hypothetical protein